MSSENYAVTKNSEGGSYIPASQRPDGTWRKPRRVRDGYVPQEEVPLYESKGRQIAAKQNTNCPVGLPPEMVAEAKAKREAREKAQLKCPIPGLIIKTDDKKKKKKTVADEMSESFARASLSPSSGASKNLQLHVPADPAKRLKNLKKKLREIEVLEVKLANGEIENPEKDQVEKVKNKHVVVSEITKLEDLVNN